MSTQCVAKLFSTHIGIDLGTANCLVYVRDLGIVLNEPSVVAIKESTHEVLNVGSEAKSMLGKCPGNIRAIRPMKDGVIADFEITEEMLRYFIQKAIRYVPWRKRLLSPRVLVAVPSGITEVEKRAVKDSAKRAGAKLLAGEEAVRISRNGDGFTVMTASGKEIHTGKLIIATGGLSYPATGSTGDGYAWAAGLGHKIRQCFPSLTAIVPAGYKTVSCKSSAPGHIDRAAPLAGLGKSLAGNSLKNISLTVRINGDIAAEEFGDMDFTDGGIEGPVGFKVSRKCVKAIMNGSKTVISLDLKPAVETDVLERRINSLAKDIEADPRSRNKRADAKFRVLLGKLMPGTLIDGFLKCNRDAGTDNLAGLLKNWEFPVAGYVGYERCVVTAGGVSTDEVSAKTMESKLVPGLYFAGEVLDIDGDTGGYNLQCAFSTGFLAGRSAAASRSSRA